MNRFVMLFLRSVLGSIAAPMLLARAATYSIPYQVSLQRLAPGSGAMGFATIFTEYNTTSTLVGYAGIVEGVEPNLLAAFCNATNGCGVHIHNGTSCTNTTTQGGHYWVKTGTITVDPWINARYSSDTNGTANFQGVLDIGTTDVIGRVFVGTLPELRPANSTIITCAHSSMISSQCTQRMVLALVAVKLKSCRTIPAVRKFSRAAPVTSLAAAFPVKSPCTPSKMILSAILDPPRS